MKLGELTDRIARVRFHCPDSSEDLAADRDTLHAVGLRNVVAHGYSNVDPARIYTAATTGLRRSGALATEVSGWVERQTVR